MLAVKRFLIKDKVFLIALILALVSILFIPPSLDYLGYVNGRVLVIMLTLMISVAGLYETHFFDYVATRLVLGFKHIRAIALVIVMVTFFLAMLLTNDAVLLTLIPFTLFLTTHTGTEKHAIPILILQTIAANMGSALTPMGDPQNIYLYAFYDIPFQSFIMTTLPITVTGGLLVFSATILWIPRHHVELNLVTPSIRWQKLFLYVIILVNALLLVLKVVPIVYAMSLTVLVTLVFARHLFRKVDYHLLLTFLCFFVLTGNLSQMTWIKEMVDGVLSQRLSVLFTSILTSQVISNVPAAVLLSTFTDPTWYRPLLQGVNIGALGSLIGSLASLITFKYVLMNKQSEVKRYLITYTLVTLTFMLLITVVVIISG